MNATMTERFSVAGALLVKLFGRPSARRSRSAGRAARVRDIGVLSAMYGAHLLRRDHAGRLAGARRWSTGWAAGWRSPGSLERRRRRRARAAADPPVRAAHRAVQRPGRRHERDGVLRPRLRGARPRADDPRGARRRGAPGRRPLDRVRRGVVPLPLRQPRSRCLTGGSVAARARRAGRRAARRVLPDRAGPAGRAGRAVRGRQVDHRRSGVAALRRDRRQRAGRRHRRPPRDAAVAAGRDRRGQPGRAPLPRHDPGEPALRPAGGDGDGAVDGAGGRADRGRWSVRCPTGWTPSSATAVTGCPAARSSGWRSPACCSRGRAS